MKLWDDSNRITVQCTRDCLAGKKKLKRSVMHYLFMILVTSALCFKMFFFVISRQYSDEGEDSQVCFYREKGLQKYPQKSSTHSNY